MGLLLHSPSEFHELVIIFMQVKCEVLNNPFLKLLGKKVVIDNITVRGQFLKKIAKMII